MRRLALLPVLLVSLAAAAQTTVVPSAGGAPGNYANGAGYGSGAWGWVGWAVAAAILIAWIIWGASSTNRRRTPPGTV